MLSQVSVYSESPPAAVRSLLQGPDEKRMAPHEVSAFRMLREGDLGGERVNLSH